MIIEKEGKEISKLSIYKSFISGGIAGVVAKTLTAPLDRIKLFFIVRERKFTYKAARNDLFFIIKQNGYRNLWRGNHVQLLRIFPQAAIQFSSVDFFKSVIADPIEKDRKVLKRVALFSCGGMAGILAQVATYPLDLVRTRLAMEKARFNYSGLTHCFQSIYQDRGVQGFYEGVTTTMMGIVFYVGTSFLIYSLLKEETQSRPMPYMSSDFLFGAIGGLSGQAVSYPFDIVRKRQQSQRLLQIKGEVDLIRNTRQMILYIYQSEGILNGFYKGISLNLIKGPLATGTAWTVKNYINRNIDQKYKW